MNWIDNLKVGDKVILGDTSIRTVEKITPKGFIKVCGETYGKDGLIRSKHRYYWSSIKEATPEAVKEIEEKE